MSAGRPSSTTQGRGSAIRRPVLSARAGVALGVVVVLIAILALPFREWVTQRARISDLQAQVAADATAGLANATAYLDLFGRVLVGWLWLRQALLASRALNQPGLSADNSEAHFYQGKL